MYLNEIEFKLSNSFTSSNGMLQKILNDAKNSAMFALCALYNLSEKMTSLDVNMDKSIDWAIDIMTWKTDGINLAVSLSLFANSSSNDWCNQLKQALKKWNIIDCTVVIWTKSRHRIGRWRNRAQTNDVWWWQRSR